MEFEVKAIDGKTSRLIVYSGENGESSVGYACSQSDLDCLLAEARAAMAGQPVTNEGMFAMVAGQDRQRPYRLIAYANDHSDGFRMTMIDINKLLATLLEQQGGKA